MNRAKILEEVKRRGMLISPMWENELIEFAAVIAGMQREADLSFINREGRKLPAACQQKAVQHVIAKVMDEGLVTAKAVTDGN